jgi:hypothetical protein
MIASTAARARALRFQLSFQECGHSVQYHKVAWHVQMPIYIFEASEGREYPVEEQLLLWWLVRTSVWCPLEPHLTSKAKS